MKKPVVIIYAQSATYSSNAKENGTIKDQIDMGKTYAEENSFFVESVFFSGGDKDQGLQPLLTYLEGRARSPFLLVVRDYSRLSRNLNRFEEVVELIHTFGGEIRIVGSPSKPLPIHRKGSA